MKTGFRLREARYGGRSKVGKDHAFTKKHDARGTSPAMTFWVVLTVNSVTFGGLLFLLSAGFSLIFGLMRIPNLTHGSLFMLGAYVGATFLVGLISIKLNFWLAAIVAT